MRLDSLLLALEQSTLGGVRRILDSNPAGDNGQRLTLPEEPPEGLRPSYNVAPNHVMPIIRPAGNGRELVMAVWPLIPFWTKDIKARAYNTINARAETIRTKPAFRQPFERRRCLVPATGWYEWQDLGKRKKKRRSVCVKAEPFAFVGVWGVWKGHGGPGVTSFAIVITEPAPSSAQYHDRMPLVLEDSQFDEWMRGTPDQAAALMVPYAGAIDAWEVSADIGNVKNNRPGLLDRVEPL
jgi:putative SOS response-associated peptidase YedK